MDNLTINERIREIRRENNLNQKTFADAIGLKQNTISNIEQIGYTVTEQNIKFICNTFGICEEWLRTGKEPKYDMGIDKYSEAVANIGISDPKAKQAILDYWNMTDIDKELFWNFIDKFILKKQD